MFRSLKSTEKHKILPADGQDDNRPRTLPCASTSDRDQGLSASSLRPHPSSTPHFWRFFLFLFTAFRVRMTSKERTQCGTTKTGDAISPYDALLFHSKLIRIPPRSAKPASEIAQPLQPKLSITDPMIGCVMPAPTY